MKDDSLPIDRTHPSPPSNGHSHSHASSSSPTSPSSKERENEKETNNGHSQPCDESEAASSFARVFQINLALDECTQHDAYKLRNETKTLLSSTVGALGSGTEEEMVRTWNACILYCASRLRRSEVDAPDSSAPSFFTLSQLLRATRVGVWDFFRELSHFLQKSESVLTKLYGDDSCSQLAQQVKEVQAKLVHMSDLFSHYKRKFQTLFASSGAAVASTSVHLRFGWMLFLALRAHSHSQLTDLVTCTNGLIGILVIMVIHMPVQYRRFSLNDSETFVLRSPNGVRVMESLCNLYNASEQDVGLMVKKANDILEHLLRIHPDQTCNGSSQSQLQGIDTDGICFFSELMGDIKLSSHLESLDRDYEELYYKKGELDERLFLTEETLIVGSSTSNGGSAKRKIEAISSSPAKTLLKGGLVSSSSGSPCPSPMKLISARLPPPTPVSSTMTTAKWLRTVIAPLPSDPPTELLGFFKACDTDITNEAIHRAQVLLEATFFLSNGLVGGCWGSSIGRQDTSLLIDRIWAEHRRSEALKLYYRVLNAMCRAESQRLQCNNLSALLKNERFHRCMLACSAELVLAAHKTVHMTFPAVLAPTGITPFDLSKVIESFVRHEETLPRELKRHLNSLEERLLESLAWQKGSSMYNSLIIAKPRLQGDINRLQLLADPMPSLDALKAHFLHYEEAAQSAVFPTRAESSSGESQGQISSPQRQTSSPSSAGPAVRASIIAHDQAGVSFLSPIKEKAASSSKSRAQPPLQSAFASPQQRNPSGGGETCADTVINVFFEKVLKLAAIRIKNITEGLKQPHYMMEEVYRMVQYTLQQETSLFFNRHIDQIILCCFYGICKVNKIDLTFRAIVTEYRKQPQSKLELFRAVLMNSPGTRRSGKRNQDTGDIISFYNEVFVPITKGFLVQLRSNVSCTSTSSRNAEDSDKFNGQSPESPKRPLPFPSLPDMSPKKVSANHNVYVSPLRSSKVESLTSPHKRSMYACVGEGTRAYQSPSKDLKEINYRLNSRRFGRLDFSSSGLVSDSLVAGTLYPSNTASASAPAAATNNDGSTQLTSDSVQSHSWSTSTPQPSPSKRPCNDR